jgi:excisionase family DNA binding protein
MQDADSLPRLLTLEEAAAFTRVHVETLRRKIKEKVGPAVIKNGRTVRIRREKLLAWLERYENEEAS